MVDEEELKRVWGFWLVSMVFHGSMLVFHGSWSIFVVPGRFLWFFIAPGWFFMVFQGSRLVFHGFSPNVHAPTVSWPDNPI